MIALIMGAGISLVFTMATMPVFIRLLTKKQYGQVVRDDGPTSHAIKSGTPTMGGVIIVLAVILSYFLTHGILTLMGRATSGVTASGLLALLLFAGMGLVGFLDDFIKIAKKRSLGLRAWEKIVLQAAVGIAFAVLALNFPNAQGLTPASTAISFVRDTNIDLAFAGPLAGLILFVLWSNLIVTGTTNGVNLTDGLDGLAAGVSIMVFGAYTLIGIWQNNQACGLPASGNVCYTVRDPMDLALLGAILCGALIGFLWWNAKPAKIFMGDTGSLAIGGAVAAFAILSRTAAAAGRAGGPVRDDRAVGHHPGRLLQALRRQARLQDGAAAAPLRALRLGRGERRGPLLDPRRALCRRGHGHLLFRMGRGTVTMTDLSKLTRWESDWAGLRVVVAGLGLSGFSAADTLIELGAHVVVVDGADTEVNRSRADTLKIVGATDVLLGAAHTDTLPRIDGEAPQLVIASPGWNPRQPMLAAAAEAGIEIWGDVELAWRVRTKEGRKLAEWVVITGTNGKTTTVGMTESIFKAAGLRAIAAGNVGTPILDAIRDPEGFDVIALELSSFQLHFTHTISPLASVVLNIAEDHVDWHGGFENYKADKAKIYERTRVAAIYNADERVIEAMVENADVIEGCRAVGFTTGRAVAEHGRRGRGPVGGPRVHRGPPQLGGRARGAGPDRRGRPAAHRRQRRGRRGAGPRLRRGTRGRGAGAEQLRCGGPPHPGRGTPRRRAVDQRFQGDEPARGQRLAGRLRLRGVDRRRPFQGR